MLDATRCYRALVSRDRRFDGRFFVGVRTTGVYCRPICPARTPLQINTTFFPCAAAAEAAGFRPCRRCRPETAAGTPAWMGASATVSRALRLIHEGALDRDDVEGLAHRLGVGSRHLRRLFEAQLGATPSGVARTRRVHFARRLIDQTALPMSEIALASGFGSVRRFNAAVRSAFGASPATLRARTAPTTSAVAARQSQPRQSQPRRHRTRSSPPARTSSQPHARSRSRTSVRTASRIVTRARDQREPDPGGTGDTIVLRLAYRPPLDWDGLLAFLRARAIPGVEQVDHGAYRRGVVLGESSGVLEARPLPHRAEVEVRVQAGAALQLQSLAERVARLFDLGADPLRIAEQLSSDPLLSPRLRAHPGVRVPGGWDGFEIAVRAVLGQQITVRAATTLAGRIAAALGPRLAHPSAGITHAFPPPEAVADAPLEKLGVIGQRARCLRELAGLVASGALSLTSGGDCDLEAAVARLSAIRGIGAWTAQVIAMRGLGEPDAFPAGDLGVRRALAIGRGSSAAPREQELLARAEAWRPWRAYGVMLLWQNDTK